MKRLKSFGNLFSLTILSATALLIVTPTIVCAGAFTAGNLAIEQLDLNSTSSTFSIVEVNSVSGGLVQTIPIPSTGGSALRQASNGSTGRVVLSNDGSLVGFTGAEDPTGVADETTILTRGVGTLDSTGAYVLQASYTGVSKNQTRAATTVDNSNWIFSDKGGIYLKNASSPANSSNIRLVRAFGGVVYGINAQNAGVVKTVSADGITLTVLPGLAAVSDGSAQDFYMISSQNNGTYDTIYINDGLTVAKYTLNGGLWSLTGSVSWGLPSGVLADGICAANANDGSGNVILYATTGANNYVFTVRDSAGFNAAPVLSPPVTLYTDEDGAYLKGIDFVPQPSSGGLLIPPTLTPAANITVDSNSFAIAFPGGAGATSWLAHITNITVAGVTMLSPTFTNGITKGSSSITFDMTISPIYRTAGSLSIVIFANGYGDDLVSQSIAPGAATHLAIKTQPGAPAANGGTLVTNPVVVMADNYGNPTTNSVAAITASVGSGAWSLGAGSGITQLFTNGTATFTNLSAISPAAVSGATITFTASGPGLGGLSSTASNSSPLNIPGPVTKGFTAGNLAVFQLDAVAKNSTFSILELNPNTVNQSSPVNTFAISATGSNALRNASSGTTGRLADNDNGTYVCFTGFADGSSATPDETAINPRGVATLDASGNFVLQTSYIGIGGGTANQTRGATSFDNLTWLVGDKGGVYTNNENSPYIGGTSDKNIRCVKSFGSAIYGIQQQSGSVVATLLQIVPINGQLMPGISDNALSYYAVAGLPQDNAVVDFYLVKSGAHGSIFDVVYYIDQINETSGSIKKYSYSGLDGSGVPMYSSSGSIGTTNGGDGLCVAVNPNGGVDIYYTTGAGGTPGNSLVKLHDAAAWDQPINVTSTNILYTVSSQSTLKGVAFAPVGLKFDPPHVIAGNVTFAFTNSIGLNFSIQATNILTVPTTNWPVIGTATENPAESGHYQFTDPSPASASRFYILRQP